MTEVGLIPEDWGACPLPEIVWFQEGPGLRKWQFRSDGLKVINVTNLQENGYLDLSKTERHIAWEEFERTYKHFLIDDGDIVMASSGNSYCKTAVVRRSDQPLLMNTSVIRFKAKDRVDRFFILIYLKSKYFKDQIDLMITGGAQPNFGPAHLVKVLIPLPPTLAEQNAIAEALSDTDSLIESMEQLLTKKRQIKKGAMQELLTGKTRLPGFHAEWETKRLGEVAPIRKGELITGTTLVPGSIPVVAGGKQPAYFHGRANRFGKTVTVSASGANAGYVAYWDKPIFASDCSTISDGPSYSIEFLFYTLVLRQETIYRAQIGGAQPHIHGKDLAPLALVAPSLREQAAIATVLSDMDTEIAALEAKLSKARQLKQGMMRELLTGRIRLV